MGLIKKERVKMFCKNCGANVEDNHEFCASCGSSTRDEAVIETVPLVEEVAVVEKVFEEPVIAEAKFEAEAAPAKKPFNKMLLAIPAVLIVVIAAVMMMFGGSDAGYFRNSEWGMSVSEVEKAEGRDIYLEGTSAILFIVDDFDCVEGNDVSVMYSFTSGKLTSAFVSIDYSGVSVYSVLYDLYDLYCDRYGDPTVDGGAMSTSGKLKPVKSQSALSTAA